MRIKVNQRIFVMDSIKVTKRQQRHDMYDFMVEVSHQMKQEYGRIFNRATEDPGTAGDEGEDNWAEFLRKWLPATYHVVTKGRILGSDGTASPQVDVLILNPNYPEALRNKKLYFAGGVIAAFECKLTLRKRHIDKIITTAKYIKSIENRSTENHYTMHNSRMIYGVLAHSHEWKTKTIRDTNFQIMQYINKKLVTQNVQLIQSPDIFCISDTTSYIFRKSLRFGQDEDTSTKDFLLKNNIDVAISYGYSMHWVNEDDNDFNGAILGSLITNLTRKMAYYDPSIRKIAEYYQDTLIEGVYIQEENIDLTDINLEDFLDDYEASGGKDNQWNPWGKSL